MVKTKISSTHQNVTTWLKCATIAMSRSVSQLADYYWTLIKIFFWHVGKGGAGVLVLIKTKEI